MEQGSEEWLEIRKRHITSSDAAIICGKNPWKTPYKLWREKQDLSPLPVITNEKMQRGTELEPIAREWFIKETGIDVKPKIEFNDFLMASLDGYSHKERMILEIKCGEKAAQQAEEGVIPDYYMCQIQHQLLTTGCQRAIYMTYWHRENIYVDFRIPVVKLIEVKRDEEFIGTYLELAREFYMRLINYDPPPPTLKDYQERNDEAWEIACREHLLAKENLKEAEKKEKQTRENLIALSNDQPSRGFGIKTMKVARKGAIDYSLVPQLKDIDLEVYRKLTTEHWAIYVDREEK